MNLPNFGIGDSFDFISVTLVKVYNTNTPLTDQPFKASVAISCLLLSLFWRSVLNSEGTSSLVFRDKVCWGSALS